MKKNKSIVVEFNDEKALNDLQKRLNKIDTIVKQLARELCYASNDPKANRSLTIEERNEYHNMAKAAIGFLIKNKEHFI